MRQSKKPGGDPYYYWKIVNMILAGGVLLLAVFIIIGEEDGILVPIVFSLGLVMCSLSGIMEMAREKKVIGYICSVFAGIMAVALIMSIIQMW